MTRTRPSSRTTMPATLTECLGDSATVGSSNELWLHYATGTYSSGGVVVLGSLDRSDDRAPYRQIADQLRRAIERGDLGPGDRLPSEAELIAHYNVARMTARQAIQELHTEGRVVA